MLPCATSGPGGAPFLDALFTATSATCVTGLVIHDTALYWAPFGQVVLLLLIQIGGMGVVTMAVAIFMFSGRKISLKQRWVMQESISAPQVGGIVRMTGFILKAALLLEGIGTLLLALRFCPQFGLGKGLWYALFHAVSAFCNAGFDLMATEEVSYPSLTGYAGDPLVSLTIAGLIVLGGIGFLTWHDFRMHGIHWSRYRLQSKLVLCTTAALLLAGFLFFVLYEFRQAPVAGTERGRACAERGISVGQSAYGGFQYGGFDTAQSAWADDHDPSDAGRRGAPGSTAGGFKVTTLAILLLGIRGGILPRGQYAVSGAPFFRRCAAPGKRTFCAVSAAVSGWRHSDLRH